MLEFGEVKLKNIIIHHVGNSLQEEGMKLSRGCFQFKEDIVKELLLKYFLSPFKAEDLFKFTHESDLNLNEMFTYARRIFSDPDSFFLQSINVAKHLYSKSNHHNIKGGEFYMVYFEDVILKGDVVDAIGLFKSENKDTFLKVFESGDNFELEHQQGVNINKLDKGCLIFNTGEEEGYKLCIVDNTNKGKDAFYWKEEFLKVQPFQDNYFHTKNYMKLCKDFCEDVLDQQLEVAKADQIEIMNRSLNYFSKNESFNIRQFEEEVMGQEDLIEAFQGYKTGYQEKQDIPVFDEFDISSGAVKKTKKIFKSVIKLDKNFHIYIHGNRDYIERGFDDNRNLNYYQVYFKEEN